MTSYMDSVCGLEFSKNNLLLALTLVKTNFSPGLRVLAARHLC